MKLYLFIFGLSLNLLSMPSAWATSVLPLSLEQLSTRASLIFYGEVVSNQVKKDEQSGYIATFTEFKIINLIKGNAGNTHTIKQIGGRLGSANTTLRIHGVPEYKTGNKYVVFLPGKSNLGFCSPLGLYQGSFSVLNINGEQTVSNGRNLTEQATQNRRNVQIPLAVRASNPSRAHLDDFINTVRAYNRP
jgi:hypothetical protein